MAEGVPLNIMSYFKGASTHEKGVLAPNCANFEDSGVESGRWEFKRSQTLKLSMCLAKVNGGLAYSQINEEYDSEHYGGVE